MLLTLGARGSCLVFDAHSHVRVAAEPVAAVDATVRACSCLRGERVAFCPCGLGSLSLSSLSLPSLSISSLSLSLSLFLSISLLSLSLSLFSLSSLSPPPRRASLVRPT